jgi:hypothetical protein
VWFKQILHEVDLQTDFGGEVVETKSARARLDRINESQAVDPAARSAGTMTLNSISSTS